MVMSTFTIKTSNRKIYSYCWKFIKSKALLIRQKYTLNHNKNTLHQQKQLKHFITEKFPYLTFSRVKMTIY